MSRKMILLPAERYNAMVEQSKESVRILESPHTTSTVSPDVKIKLLREKKMRKRQRINPTPLQQKQSHHTIPQHPHFSPDLSRLTGKKRTRGKAFLKHIDRNNDRIKFNKGELQFDGIKTGGSDMDDLTTALIDDKNPGKVAGWNDLMRALEATAAPASLYTRWRKSHKKGDWGALSH